MERYAGTVRSNGERRRSAPAGSIRFLHNTASTSSTDIRHAIATKWDQTWSDTQNRAQHGESAVGGWINTLLHNTASTFDSIRHAIATKWDQTWSDTTSRVSRGVHRVGGAGEDDVVHLGAAQRPGALGAEHPHDRIHDVRLARPVGADDDTHPGFELERGLVREA